MRQIIGGSRATVIGLALLWFAELGCRPGGDGDGDTDSDVDCTRDVVSCDGNTARTCNDTGDGWRDSQDCQGTTPVCAGGIGCAACLPYQRQCDGNDVQECSADGSGWATILTCSDDDSCNNGACGSLCDQAVVNRSYEGCEYRAVTLMNSQVSADFLPAIVISNRNGEPATITVTRGGAPVAEETVPSDSTQTIELDWILDLKQEFPDDDGESDEQSTNVPDGSYRVVSSLPVTVYQFNPLEYTLDHDCADDDVLPGDGVCYSFSNDASLLLPVHVLTEHYIVMSRPNLARSVHVVDPYSGDEADLASFSPSTMAVINPQDAPVTVDIQFSAPTQAGPGLIGYDIGDIDTFTIEPGGVLQIAARISEACSADWIEPESTPCGDMNQYECTDGYCDQQLYDMTGTEITASAPVAVFGGHNCAFIPYFRWACDHLEEQLFPFETWGKHFVISQSVRENEEPDVIRVLSGADGNRITFEPSSVHDEVNLDRGDFVEFEAHGGFNIRSDEPILVGQFLVGQNYNSYAEGSLPPGDPSFTLAVPVEQYRAAYNFLTPSTYDRSYVNITVTQRENETIVLDGESLAGQLWEAIGETGYSTLRRELSAGSHTISSTSGTTFGITVYGYGQFTSYMYPGGLNLQEIAVW